MQAHYIKRIEIHALWNRTNIAWELRPDVNILSGLNGVGKSTILNRSVDYLTAASGELTGKGVKGVSITFDNPEADAIPFDFIHSYAYSSEQAKQLDVLLESYTQQTLRSGSKQKFRETVDKLFGYTAKSLDRTAADIRFVQEGDTILPAQLSAGEKQMLIILLTAVLRDGAYCVLFMDEPETSLHIEWQQVLIRTLRALNPHAQLILSTHSPAVIMDGWLDAVTEVSDISTPVKP